MGHGSAVLGAGTYVEAEWFCFEEGTMSLLIPTEFKVTKGNTARLEMAIMIMILIQCHLRLYVTQNHHFLQKMTFLHLSFI